MGILILISILLIGASLHSAISADTQFTQDTYSGWIAALSTFVIACLTIFLAFETQAMRKLQQAQIDNIRTGVIRPDLDVFLSPSDVAMSLAEIVIINNGNGSAHLVRAISESRQTIEFRSSSAAQ